MRVGPIGARLALGAALTAVAGCVDAIGFLRLGGLFVSFMSGNSTRLVVVLTQAKWSEAATLGILVALFVAGAFAGRLIVRFAGRRRRPAVLGAVAALLALAIVAGRLGSLDVALMVLAMGVQNQALRRVGSVRISPTYITGALVSLGSKLADALFGARWGWVPYALQWLGLICGAAVGAMAYSRFGVVALAIPAAGAGALALLAARMD